jgi:hypothetical protein
MFVFCAIFPTAQSMQEACAFSGWYFPAVQFVHGPALPSAAINHPLSHSVHLVVAFAAVN